MLQYIYIYIICITVYGCIYLLHSLVGQSALVWQGGVSAFHPPPPCPNLQKHSEVLICPKGRMQDTPAIKYPQGRPQRPSRSKPGRILFRLFFFSSPLDLFQLLGCAATAAGGYPSEPSEFGWAKQSPLVLSCFETKSQSSFYVLCIIVLFLWSVQAVKKNHNDKKLAKFFVSRNSRRSGGDSENIFLELTCSKIIEILFWHFCRTPLPKNTQN